MALRRRLLGFVLFALVAAQTLGLVHRIAHAGNAGGLQGAVQVQPAAQFTGAHWADALKSGHADDVTCHVFDQASPGGCAWTSPPAVHALVFPEVLIARQQGEAQARRAALCEARGPPSFS